MDPITIQSRQLARMQVVVGIDGELIARAREQAFQHLAAHDPDHAIAALMIVYGTCLPRGEADHHDLDLLVSINGNPRVRLGREADGQVRFAIGVIVGELKQRGEIVGHGAPKQRQTSGPGLIGKFGICRQSHIRPFRDQVGPQLWVQVVNLAPALIVSQSVPRDGSHGDSAGWHLV